jgi:hypothetical protein
LKLSKLRRDGPSKFLKGSAEKSREQVERKRRRLTNKSRRETLLVREVRRRRLDDQYSSWGTREFPRIVGYFRIEGGYSVGEEKGSNLRQAGASIGITRSVDLLVHRHIGSS